MIRKKGGILWSSGACPVHPALLSLTRALKGSFLVMSSNREDSESISRSILLTFSLGYRVRSQGQVRQGKGDFCSSLLPFFWGGPAPPWPPYLWRGRQGALSSSIFFQGGWRGREDFLLQRCWGKGLIDRGRRGWEGTSQSAQGFVAVPKDGRGR